MESYAVTTYIFYGLLVILVLLVLKLFLFLQKRKIFSFRQLILLDLILISICIISYLASGLLEFNSSIALLKLFCYLLMFPAQISFILLCLLLPVTTILILINVMKPKVNKAQKDPSTR